MLALHGANVDIDLKKRRRQFFRYGASRNTTFLFRADGGIPCSSLLRATCTHGGRNRSTNLLDAAPLTFFRVVLFCMDNVTYSGSTMPDDEHRTPQKRLKDPARGRAIPNSR